MHCRRTHTTERPTSLSHTHIHTHTHTHIHTHTACPEGLDWDGVSCDLIVGEDISDDSEASHWSFMGGRQTLIFMLLASLVVMVISLVMRARTVNRSRTLEPTSKHRDKMEVGNSRRTFRTPLVNRVEDLLVRPP